MSNYDVDYFIKKFEAIPDERWTVGQYHLKGACCALGHCGALDGSPSEEADALDSLLHGCTVTINDNIDGKLMERTPAARILAALRRVKEGGVPCPS